MKERALKLADELEDYMTSLGWKTHQASAMIRRLVEELDKQTYKADLLENRLKVIVGSKPTITKLDGKVVAVTMTDDEQRVTDVLWEAQKPLDKEELYYLHESYYGMDDTGQWNLDYVGFAKAIEERHGIK